MTKDEIYDAMVQCCETFRYDIWPEAIDRLADVVLAESVSTMDAIAWKTTHKAVCVPITEDLAVAEMWKANGYEVIALGRVDAGELLDASSKPIPYHSFEMCAEEVWQELASATSEPVGEVYMIEPFKRYDKHGIGHEAGGVLSVRLFRELPVGTKLYTAKESKPKKIDAATP